MAIVKADKPNLLCIVEVGFLTLISRNFELVLMIDFRRFCVILLENQLTSSPRNGCMLNKQLCGNEFAQQMQG